MSFWMDANLRRSPDSICDAVPIFPDSLDCRSVVPAICRDNLDWRSMAPSIGRSQLIFRKLDCSPVELPIHRQSRYPNHLVWWRSDLEPFLPRHPTNHLACLPMDLVFVVVHSHPSRLAWQQLDRQSTWERKSNPRITYKWLLFKNVFFQPSHVHPSFPVSYH